MENNVIYNSKQNLVNRATLLKIMILEYLNTIGEVYPPYRLSRRLYIFLTGNRKETIRCFYSPSGQLNSSIFNLDSHTKLAK